MCGDHVMRILHLTHPSRKGSGATASLVGADHLFFRFHFQTSDTLPCVRLVVLGDLNIKEVPANLQSF